MSSTPQSVTEWTPSTVAGVLAAQAATLGDQVAMTADGRSLTFGALAADVARVAAGLSDAGLRHGDHLAICMENRIEWQVVFMAAATIGAVTVPVNTRFKAEELAFCLGHADVRMLVTSDRFLSADFIGMLRGICPEIDSGLPGKRLPLLEQIFVLGADVPAGCQPFEALRGSGGRQFRTSPDDVLLMQFTSGTTAHPKGVILTHDSMLRDAFEAGRRLRLSVGDRYYSPRPLFHVAGTTMSSLASLVAGATYLTSATFDAREALDCMEREACTHTSGNDTLFLMMMNHPSFPERRLSLRAGWAAASAAVMQQIHDRMGIAGICSAYGMSECSGNIAIASVDEPLEIRVSGYCLPLPGTEVAVVDPETAALCPVGTAGEIRIRGWNVMRGYYKQPEETARTLTPDGWLMSGDLGILDAAGRVACVGRLKDTIRVGGENVSPAEVEDVLHSHPGIKQAQAIGVPDVRLGEVVAVYAVPSHAAPVDERELIEWLGARLARFKVPRYLRFVESFDGIGMTASSKVQKRKLREHAIADLDL